MLEITNISKSFDGVKAVQGVSVTVATGSITSLIGPNGAGKSTLFNLITGFLRPDQGSISYAGESLTRLQPWQIARKGVSRSFQNLRLLRKLSVLENVCLGVQGQRGEGFVNALVSHLTTSPAHRGVVSKARELLAFVGLQDHHAALAENLSYGQQKLLSIACCLAMEPRILLLDEPVAGVQPEMIGKIEGLLRELVRNQSRTVFLIEHDMEFVLRVSDTVVVMDEGRKIVEDKPEAIRENVGILEAYLS